MKNHDKKPSLSAFFILVFFMTLPLYVLVAISSRAEDFSEEMTFPFIGLAAFIPITAAVITTLKDSGSSGTKKLLRSSFSFRRITKKRWIIPAIFIFPFIFICGYFILISTGSSISLDGRPLIAMPVLFVLFSIMAFGEEGGWMGYAFDPMEKKFGVNRAALILGSIWAVWHVPFYIFMMGDWVPILVLPVSLLGMRIILVRLYKKAGSSVVTAILFHTMYNLSIAMVPNYTTTLGTLITCLFILLSAVIATLFIGRDPK